MLETEEMVTSQHIQDMPYLRDTIKETMRWAWHVWDGWGMCEMGGPCVGWVGHV